MSKRGNKFWLRVGLLVLLVLLFLLNFLIKAQTTTKSNLTNTSNFDLANWMIRMLLFLCLIIGLIYISLYLLKKYVYRTVSDKSDGIFQILESTSIAPKKSLVLVKVLNRLLVLGISESQINTLTEFEETAVSDQLTKIQATNLARSGVNFQTQLGNFLRKVKRQQ